MNFIIGPVAKRCRQKRHLATGGANQARTSNIMVDGMPATQFISSLGGLLEDTFNQKQHHVASILEIV